MLDLFANASAGAIAGAGSGILVVLGQAFLLDAPEASFRVKRSLRYYLQRIRQLRGRGRTVCRRCWRADPEPVQNVELLPEGWEEAPPDVAWLRCPECKDVWGVRNVIVGYRPMQGEDQG